ncbi:MAG: abortive infection family protein [Deltaproteobacteria bacterium]|nr:abortive infection family protein [Deltaproteobacteria bacterium]
MYLPIFSKRHKERLKSGKLSIDLSSSTKQRVLYAMDEFNERTGHTDPSGWVTESSLLFDTGEDLCKEHGWPCLKSFVPGKAGMQEVAIADFIRSGAPQYIFDAIELYSKALAEARYPFQEEVNKIFTDSQLPWRLADDVIFQVDSEYMAEALASASKLLTTRGFEGAKQEFQEARSHFDSGDYKGTIHHANLALESTMKSILGIEREKPGKLIRRMIDSEIVPDYYDKFLDNFEQLLRTVNIARNEEKGAGHGQGAEVAQVPAHLAELVLNFCGALVAFLVKHHIDSQPQEEPEVEEQTTVTQDDIPF